MGNPLDDFNFDPEKLNELPQTAFSDFGKEVLTQARERLETTGQEPSIQEYSLLGDAAESVEMERLEKYHVQLRMDGPLLDIAASAHKKQFQMEPLSPQEAEDLDLVTEVAEDIEQRQQGGAGIEDRKHRDELYSRYFERTSAERNKEYQAERGSSGSPELMEVAAYHQSRKDVYGIQPDEEATTLLDAARKQRQEGVAELFQKEYVEAGCDRGRAKIAGDARADILLSPFGEEKQFSPEEIEIQRDAIQLADIHHGSSSAVVDRAKKEVDRQNLLANAQNLMTNAREAGIAVSSGDTNTIQGDNYSVVQQKDTTIIQGDGKKLIADGNDILKLEGFKQEDFDRFQRLGQRSADDLRQAAASNPSSQQRPSSKAVKQEVEV